MGWFLISDMKPQFWASPIANIPECRPLFHLWPTSWPNRIFPRFQPYLAKWRFCYLKRWFMIFLYNLYWHWLYTWPFFETFKSTLEPFGYLFHFTDSAAFSAVQRVEIYYKASGGGTNLSEDLTKHLDFEHQCFDIWKRHIRFYLPFF